MKFDWINTLVMNHILAEPGAVAIGVAFLAKIDDVILFLLRFFDAQTIKDELDRLDALAKARVDKDAANAPKP